MIRALIIDDEPIAANVLQLMLERHIPEVTEIRTATSIAEARKQIAGFEPNLVFQDVVMPEKNGFELLSEFPEITFEIIFTTAFNEYAIQAIRFSALDFLLKPIDANELRAAINRLLDKKHKQLQTDSLVKNLMKNLGASKMEDFTLAVPSQNGTHFFNSAEIIRLEGEGNYTRFYLSGDRKFISAKTMKEFEDILLQHHFLRIHKSHLVNKIFIEKYQHERTVILKDKTSLPVSRQRKHEIMNALKK